MYNQLNFNNMIAKKNSRFDLESKRSAFFQLGLFVTGSLTLAAFTYSDPMMRADSGKHVASEQIQIDWNQQEQPDKPKPDPVDQVRVERPDQPSTVTDPGQISQDIRLAINTSTLPDPNVSGDLNGLPTGPKLIIGGGTLFTFDDEIFDEIVDKEAEFIGGYAELQKFIGSKIVYPQEAIEMGDEGKVYLSFVVEKDGSVSNVVVERGVTNALDREAKRVIHAFPKWIPGEVKMQKVRTRVRLPINFVLSK